MRKKIEGAFPLWEINHLTLSERIKKGHPGNVHLWWNRSPIESSAKVLEAMLKDESRADEKSKMPSEVTIVDPFCGSGCLTLAAMRSGLPVIAGDINSVAVVISKAIAEVPYRFLNCKAVFPNADVRLYYGFSGLAEDIRSYGEWVRNQLGKRLTSYYPDAVEPDEAGKQVYAWIWTRNVPCPNPACNCIMPLSSSYVISRQKDRECYAQPKVSDGHVTFEVLPGAPDSVLNGNKIGKHGAQFQCPNCGTITSDEYVKNKGISGKLGIQIMAVGFESKEGRIYTSAEKSQLNAAVAEDNRNIIIGDIPSNTRWFSPPLFGLKTYADLYTPRQLLLLNTLFDLISEAQEQCKNDAIDAGWSDDDMPLEAEGTGALAYSQAVAVYLSLAVSKMVNYQSEICTWDNRNGNIRAAFTRQAIPMTWTFGEGNPFSSVTGNLNAMLADVATTIEKLDFFSSARVLKMNALEYQYPENSVLFTELPYYDFVGYSDLSDYYYVWLRRGLKGIFTKLFNQVVSSKEELSSISEHYGGSVAQGIEAYDKGIQRFVQNFGYVASKECPSVLFFEFSKQDEVSLSSVDEIGNGQSHWENLINALLMANFQVTATLPVRTQKPNDSYDTFRIAIVFRPRMDNTMEIIRRSFIAELKRDLPDFLKKHFETDIEPHDRPYVGMGCGLSLFSKYSRVINADGSSMSCRDALRVIWSTVSEYLLNDTSDEITKEE